MSHHYQESDVSCGPAALRMTLEAAGHDAPTEAVLADALNTDLHGTRPQAFEAYLAQIGLAYKAWHGDLVPGDLRDLLESHAVMICYQSETLREGHFAVVRDLSQQTVELDDPWFGPCHCISLDAFIEQWRSEPHEQKPKARWCLAVERA